MSPNRSAGKEAHSYKATSAATSYAKTETSKFLIQKRDHVKKTSDHLDI